MIAHLKYLKYVLVHKWKVFLWCVHYGIIWRGIVHDWTKFQSVEWTPYVKNFYTDSPDKEAFEYAWMHHKNRNDHHWQHYLSTPDDGNDTIAIEMRPEAAKEMLADWLSFGGRDNARNYYLTHRNIFLNSTTKAFVESELGVLRGTNTHAAQ